jgi:hypothetical protein
MPSRLSVAEQLPVLDLISFAFENDLDDSLERFFDYACHHDRSGWLGDDTVDRVRCAQDDIYGCFKGPHTNTGLAIIDDQPRACGEGRRGFHGAHIDCSWPSKPDRL